MLSPSPPLNILAALRVSIHILVSFSSKGFFISYIVLRTTAESCAGDSVHWNPCPAQCDPVTHVRLRPKPQVDIQTKRTTAQWHRPPATRRPRVGLQGPSLLFIHSVFLLSPQPSRAITTLCKPSSANPNPVLTVLSLHPRPRRTV